ncbi:FdhD protein [Gemmobacter aquatilis]|uniref:Sulfur carrier protein FdhD n=2 Tax=Gemmobacter aquatilis TaxID=933059 RepID=A0A1H8L3S1_9RHOB|nr:FdhD protein [Gemmobacter aquatilis]
METRRPLPRLSFQAGALRAGSRVLPAEVAVALSYNGSTHAVMMATPADLVDFAYGFSLTEGIATPDEIASVDVVETAQGIDLQIWLTEAAAARQAKRRRSMAGPVGCGLCGIDSLEEALRLPRPIAPSDFALTPAQVMQAVADLPAHQPLHDATRAAHCAAFWTAGAIVAAREDVGRHNALDKLIGSLIRTPRGPGALVLTCRTSIDMVQKACVFGAPVLIAVSAPTATAVDAAEAAGLTLIALARPDGFECFTHPHRIASSEAAHVA